MPINDNSREKEKQMIPTMNNPSHADPATIFTMDKAYTLYTEGREFTGIYLGRYQTEANEWVIQLRLDNGKLQEVLSESVISWIELGTTTEG